MTSYDVDSGDESVLAVKINTTQTTGIKIAAMNVNGSTIAWANQSGGVIEIVEDVEGTRKREWISYTSGTENADLSFTLSGVSRDVARDSATLTGSGTGQSFNKGASVRFVNFHYIYNQKADIDRANTWTAVQTFGAASSITPTNTTTPVYHGQSLTTAERDALTGVVNGDWIYNETVNQTQWYEGGAWVTNDVGGSVADATTTVAGKVEIAAAADLQAATTTGDSGALVVIPSSLAVKTSSGSGDENKVPILDSTGKLATGFVPTIYRFFGDGSDGDATISEDTSLAANKFYSNLTIDSTFNLNPAGYVIFVSGTLTITGNIASNGGTGTAATTSTGGAAGSAAHSAGTLPAPAAASAGGDGGAISNGNAPAVTTTAQTVCIGANGAAGGTGQSIGGGGSGATSAGGVASITAVNSSAFNTRISMGNIFASTTVATANGGAGGGGGGGADSDTAGSGGGGGGGSGGHIVIYANVITGAGNITANGGTGGAGANVGSGAGGGGGGAGGSGGYIYLIYKDISGFSGSITASGGTGGAGGGSGAAGSSGTAGYVQKIQVQ